MPLRILLAMPVAVFVLAAPALGHTLNNARVTMVLTDPSTGFSTTDSDRVDSVTWINSAGTMTANLASNAVNGPFACNDPVEFFGQAEGYTDEGAVPLMVTGGEVSTWKSPSLLKGTASTHLKACDKAVLSGETTTAYTLSNAASKINTVKIIRTFKFNASTPVFNNSGLRAYMPRLPISIYHFVLLPNAAGTVTSYDANNCSGPCTVTDWNGSWLADDDGNGNGMVIVRDPSSENPAVVGIDSDGYSSSNVSSVVLSQPANGWTAPVVETEYLCFYDAVSWPSSVQAAGKLPSGCTVK